jgi:hypothetical protein
MEEEHHEGEEGVEGEISREELGENFGFQPFEKDEEQEEKKVQKDMSPAAIQLRIQINQLLCRYSSLKPRSSFETLQALENYTAEQLQNIYDNCINDLQSIRGTPSSEMVINVLGSGVEYYGNLPGYREMCLQDEELARDIESEMISLLYYAGSKVQIAFRLMNNAFKCYYNLEPNPNRPPEIPESEASIQRGIRSIFDEQNSRACEDEDSGLPNKKKRGNQGEVPRAEGKKRKTKHGNSENTTPV